MKPLAATLYIGGPYTVTDSMLPTGSIAQDGLLSLRTTGVGALVRWGDTFVFELQAASKWTVDPNGTLQIGVACIGGGILPGESIELALQRESVEEIGTELTLHEPVRQYHLDSAGTVTTIAIRSSGTPQPILCWQGVAPEFKHCRICAFASTARGRPVPLDVGGLLYSDIGTLLAAL
jgi:hypothetical protein